jgi:hypothetical protein
MTDRYDPVPDLASMLVAGLSYRVDVIAYADRIGAALGLGENDTPETAAEVLRRALRPVTVSGTPGEVLVLRGTLKLREAEIERLKEPGGETARGALRSLLDTVFDDIEHVVDGNPGWIDRDMLDGYRSDAADDLALPRWSERLGPVVACDHEDHRKETPGKSPGTREPAPVVRADRGPCSCGCPEKAHNQVQNNGERGFCLGCPAGTCARYEPAEGTS